MCVGIRGTGQGPWGVLEGGYEGQEQCEGAGLACAVEILRLKHQIDGCVKPDREVLQESEAEGQVQYSARELEPWFRLLVG